MRKAIAIVMTTLLCTACGMSGSDTQASNDNWFAYAYHSSPASLEADGLIRSASASPSAKPASLY